MNYRKLIIEITDHSFGFTIPEPHEYKLRKSARGILRRDDSIALIHITKNNYHILPGGGIDSGESNEEGFIREIMEETGCKCEITEKGAITLEYRNRENKVQVSYVYFANVIGEPGKVKFEQAEIDEGARLVWVKITDLKKIFEIDNPQDYDGLFIHKRDKAILEYYREKLKV